MKTMSEIKDNISNNEIIYNVKMRDIIESPIEKGIKKKRY